MGRRSRKRAAEGASTRAERDTARRERALAGATGERSERPRPGRTRAGDRPPAPWGSFPLGELVTLAGIVVMVWGFLSRDNAKIGVGLLVAALTGLELALREHLAGFRSHTTLLSGVAAFIVITILALGPGPNVVGILIAIGAAVFGACFFGFRELFKSRSGGSASGEERAAHGRERRPPAADHVGGGSACGWGCRSDGCTWAVGCRVPRTRWAPRWR